MDFDVINLETFQPLGNRILVMRHDETGLIIIPEAYRSFDRLCEVMAIGPKVKEVEVGQLVLLPGMALNHPDFETDDYAVVTEDDVAGVMNV